MLFRSLGDVATESYEEARLAVSRWVGGLENEIVFTRNTTESINLVAQGWRDSRRVLVSLSDHHSSILPWESKRTTRLAPDKDGLVDEEAFLREVSRGDVGVVCVSHLSNVTGGVVNVGRIAEACHAHGAILVLDAAQSASHGPIDAPNLGCDFLAFSGHKLGGPAGIGVLWGKAELLHQVEPRLFGGGMIEAFEENTVSRKDIPWRLEAGTPPLEVAVGLSAAIEYLWGLDVEKIGMHLQSLRGYAIEKLQGIPKLRILSTAKPNGYGPVSFYIEGHSSHAIARSLSDAYGICIRSGFHCAEPLHRHFGCGPSLRMSFFVYNQPGDVDACVDAIRRLSSITTR